MLSQYLFVYIRNWVFIVGFIKKKKLIPSQNQFKYVIKRDKKKINKYEFWTITNQGLCILNMEKQDDEYGNIYLM